MESKAPVETFPAAGRCIAFRPSDEPRLPPVTSTAHRRYQLRMVGFRCRNVHDPVARHTMKFPDELHATIWTASGQCVSDEAILNAFAGFPESEFVLDVLGDDVSKIFCDKCDWGINELGHLFARVDVYVPEIAFDKRPIKVEAKPEEKEAEKPQPQPQPQPEEESKMLKLFKDQLEKARGELGSNGMPEPVIYTHPDTLLAHLGASELAVIYAQRTEGKESGNVDEFVKLRITEMSMHVDLDTKRQLGDAAPRIGLLHCQRLDVPATDPRNRITLSGYTNPNQMGCLPVFAGFEVGDSGSALYWVLPEKYATFKDFQRTLYEQGAVKPIEFDSSKPEDKEITETTEALLKTSLGETV